MHKIKIAISGKSGCGNTTVSRAVAEKLGLKFINYTFRSVAEEKGIEFEHMCRLAENDYSYDIFLDTRQKELAAEGDCVIGSRLAIWIIDDADLKVFLDAPAEVRAGRIHMREGGDYEKVFEKTLQRDRRDTERYKKIYNIDNNNYSHADMIIDTEKYSAEEVSDLIVEKMKKTITG